MAPETTDPASTSSDDNGTSAHPGILRSGAHATRELIRKNPKVNRAYRTTIGVVGGGTTALGVVMMPLPGPGALVAIGGLTILATEFETAGKARDAGVKGLRIVTAKVQDLRAKRTTASDSAEQPESQG